MHAIAAMKMMRKKEVIVALGRRGVMRGGAQQKECTLHLREEQGQGAQQQKARLLHLGKTQHAQQQQHASLLRQAQHAQQQQQKEQQQ